MTDEELNARSQKQIELQCQFCKYRWYDYSNGVTIGCDYFCHTGHLRDRGNGPGDCRSFRPLNAKYKAKRLAKARKLFFLGKH